MPTSGTAQQTRGAHSHFYFWRGTVALLTFSKAAVPPPAPGPLGRWRRAEPPSPGGGGAHGLWAPGCFNEKFRRNLSVPGACCRLQRVGSAPHAVRASPSSPCRGLLCAASGCPRSPPSLSLAPGSLSPDPARGSLQGVNKGPRSALHPVSVCRLRPTRPALPPPKRPSGSGGQG